MVKVYNLSRGLNVFIHTFNAYCKSAVLTGFNGGRVICVEQAYENAVACSASSKLGFDAGICP